MHDIISINDSYFDQYFHFKLKKTFTIEQFIDNLKN